MRRVAILILLVSALGCRRDEAQRDAQREETFAEVAAVERLIPSSGEGYDLNRVIVVRTLSDHRIAVLNAGSNEVLMFSPAGKMEYRFGRAGKGPGEFRSPTFLSVLQDDSILVSDFDQRAVVFTDSGAVARTFTLERPPGRTPYVFPLGITASGELLGSVGIEAAKPGVTSGMTYDPLQLVVYDLNGAFLRGFEQDSIGTETFLVPQGEGVIAPLSPPFRRRGFAVAGPDGFVLATNISRDVLTVDPNGLVQRTVRVPRDDAPPDKRLVDSVRAAWAEEPAAEAGKVLRRRAIVEMPFPTAQSVVGDLRVDPSGRLWIADANANGTPGTRWHVYDGDTLLGYVDFPKAVNIKEIGADHILAVETDALGVESVLRMTLKVLKSE